MKKFNLTALLLCAAFCASCTAENAEAITTTAVTTTTAVSTEAQTTTAETTTVEITTTTAEATTTTAETTAEPAEIELKEYDFDNIEYVPFEEYTGIDFMTEEQQRSFWLATFVYEVFDLAGDSFFRTSGVEYDFYSQRPCGEICYGSGFTYDSVMSEFRSVLSEEILNDIIWLTDINTNGEFACNDGARGASADFDFYLEFSPVEVTDEKVIFQITARYADPDNREEKSYVTYDYEMVYDNGNWIVTKFEFWK